MNGIYDYIYDMNIPLLCLLGAGFLGGWMWLMTVLPARARRHVCVAALAVAAFLIVGKTLLGRTVEPDLYFPQWNPLYSVTVYWDQPDQWRGMFMNILLFVPLGGVLPHLLRGTPARRVGTAAGLGAALSAVIEVVQQLTLVGCLQTEDLLCNTLGTLIGAAVYFAYVALAKRQGK